MRLFDAHCHLQFQAFDEERDAILTHARDEGVTGVIVAGYDDQRRALVASLAQRPGVFGAAGIHPWALANKDAVWVDEQLAALHDALTREDAPWCAIGECGLDYYKAEDDAQRAVQQRALRGQLAMAQEFELPVVLHAVRCHDDLLDILDEYDLPRGGQMHAYAGPPSYVPHFVDRGMLLSFGPPLTWDGYKKVTRAFERVIAHDDTMWALETDAPDRPIAGCDDGRGAPAHIAAVARAAADILGEEVERVAGRAHDNVRRHFGLGNDALT